jgi:hypothetical protein
MAKHMQLEGKYTPLSALLKNRAAFRAPARTHGPPELVTGPGVRRLFGNISAMTVWRWRQDPSFPAPFVINNRNYFNPTKLLAWAQKKTKSKKLRPRDVR